MCDKNAECEQVLKKFKSCLNEMCLPVLNPIVINGSGTITTQFNILDVSVVITITYSSYSKRAEIKINSSLSMEDFDTFIVIQILNAINGELMDIGHICADPYCQDIFLQTTIDFSIQPFDRTRILFLLKRFAHQGFRCFLMLRKIAQMDQCPFEVLADYLAHYKDCDKKQDKTIH
jgi:hypothetical protein